MTNRNYFSRIQNKKHDVRILVRVEVKLFNKNQSCSRYSVDFSFSDGICILQKRFRMFTVAEL